MKVIGVNFFETQSLCYHTVIETIF